MKRYVLAITGASGTIYAKTLYDCLKRMGLEIHLVISDNGKLVMKKELGINENYFNSEKAICYENSDLTAPIANGSFLTNGMVIVPCSMATLGAISHGLSTNLIQRAADVCLKERRKLILVPRETPLSSIHLSNMLQISQSGGIILPAMPGFYRKPKRIRDLVDFIVRKILAHLEITAETPE